MSAADQMRRVGELTLALTRCEYANFYHTMSDWYNTFLVTQFMNVSESVAPRVLFIDAHPAGPLDHAWNSLFKGQFTMTTLGPNVVSLRQLVTPLLHVTKVNSRAAAV